MCLRWFFLLVVILVECLCWSGVLFECLCVLFDCLDCGGWWFVFVLVMYNG